MSGIAGLVRHDGGPVHPAEIHRMLNVMQHRGPDGIGVWTRANVGFGHRMLWTTPESLVERQPITSEEPLLVLTADARIDNREELMAVLRLRKDPAEISDSELILAAYARWGDACPLHLLGDFAFAIWIQAEKRLFCASDPMGVKTLYYLETPNRFAFASEIKGLLSLSDVRPLLSEERVADHLLGIFDDAGSTFYQHVLRLLPASTLSVAMNGIRNDVYWTPSASREVRYQTDEQYADAFKSIFETAVRARTRSAFPVGSTLSGGLDSSSVACMASAVVPQPIHTFSLVFPSLPEEDLRIIDERRYMNAALQHGAFEPHFVRADLLSPLGESDQMHQHLDEPNGAPNLYLHWGMFDAAREQRVRVLLDGFDGDSAISHGFDRLSDLARDLRWPTLAREITLLAQQQQAAMSRRYLARELCLKPLLPEWAANALDRLRNIQADTTDRILEVSFADRVAARTRMRRLGRKPGRWTTSSRQRHAASLREASYAHTLAVADRAGAAFGVEPRYPFFDRRLIEFCVGIPGEQKLGKGWSRYILRHAMGGVLPELIRWRKGKGNLSPNFRRGLLTIDTHTVDRVVSHSAHSLRAYVDLNVFGDLYRQFRADPTASGRTPISVFSVATLGLWLNHTGVAA